MRFIVVEGLDGSGKSTQIDLLQDFFKKNGIDYQYLHFPRTGSPFYGEMVARFLRGELGDINQVDPYLVALLYAGDRNDAKEMISNWLRQGMVVLVDRYVCSNIAFQCAKINDHGRAEELKQWILKLEYDYHKIPVPDINIFLDVPLSFTKAKLKDQREGKDRHYLKGKKDIHEESIDFQRKVRDIYLTQATEDDTFHKINCYDEKDNMLSVNEIHLKMVATLNKTALLE